MMKKKWIGRLIFVVAVILLVGAIILTTKFVSSGDAALTNNDQGLDPKTWAQDNYATQVVPAIESKAQPWGDLVKAIEANADAAGQQYGTREEGANSYSFATTITGTLAVGNFDELAIQSPDTPADVTVGFQTGPAITGSALRDACGLANFGMFTNQTAYQQASVELNNMVKQEVLANFDPTTAIGQRFTITGAFTWTGSGHVTITPVSIEAAS